MRLGVEVEELRQGVFSLWVYLLFLGHRYVARCGTYTHTHTHTHTHTQRERERERERERNKQTNNRDF